MRRVLVTGNAGSGKTTLAEERGLRLKHPEAPVLSCAGHLDALGYRIRRDGLEALPRATRRMQRRVARWMAGRGGPEPARSLASTGRRGAVLSGRSCRG